MASSPHRGYFCLILVIPTSALATRYNHKDTIQSNTVSIFLHMPNNDLWICLLACCMLAIWFTTYNFTERPGSVIIPTKPGVSDLRADSRLSAFKALIYPGKTQVLKTTKRGALAQKENKLFADCGTAEWNCKTEHIQYVGDLVNWGVHLGSGAAIGGAVLLPDQ